MKLIPIILLLSIFRTTGHCDERLIPFDNVFISVEANDFRNRPKGKSALNVSLRLSRSVEEPNGDVSIDINCFEFPAGKRMFLKDDLNAFTEAVRSASLGKQFLKETLTQTYDGKEKTIFKTVKNQDDWLIHVNRSGAEAIFDIDEGKRLDNALQEVKFGKAWFTQLLSSAKLPEQTPISRPPKSNGYYLASTLGTVQGRGIDYEVSVSSRSFRGKLQYSISHEIIFNQGRGTSSGGWVKELLDHVASALDSIAKGKNYSYNSDDNEHKYKVVANLKTKEADVTFQPGKFFKNAKKQNGHFGADQLADIKKLIKGFDERQKWFQEHEKWFFTSPK